MLKFFKALFAYGVISVLFTSCEKGSPIEPTIKYRSIKIIAHRGASSLAPENTLSAFNKAAVIGADYFELDVHLSKDDSIIVIHDYTVDRTTNGSGTVSSLTYFQLRELDAGSWFSMEFSGEKIPTLHEALLLAKEKKIKVCIELKSGSTALISKVIALVEKLDLTQEVIIFCYNFTKISQSKQLNPQIAALHLVDLLSMTTIDAVANISVEAVGARSGITKDLIEYAQKKNVEIWQWTVNNQSEMRYMIEIGISGIVTDYPQTLLEIIDR